MRHDVDILAEMEGDGRRPRDEEVTVVHGMVVEDRASGFCGDVVSWSAEGVSLRDRHDAVHHFRWKPSGFLLDGRSVTLVRPTPPRPGGGLRRTASGSVEGPPTGPVSARASRIWVEGLHDAELVEYVWGDDLRELGIVVEPMHGADELAPMVAAFDPGPSRRLGILLDHLVEGSKESRIAATVDHADVLIVGHPFVDVWAGVRPRTIGLDAWPDVPRSAASWKRGVCDELGIALEGFWPRLRNAVTSYADLEPELVGAVERLIDFVAEAP